MNYTCKIILKTIYVIKLPNQKKKYIIIGAWKVSSQLSLLPPYSQTLTSTVPHPTSLQLFHTFYSQYDMTNCATPVIHMWRFRCILCVEIQMYYICSRYMCNTHVLHM